MLRICFLERVNQKVKIICEETNPTVLPFKALFQQVFPIYIFSIFEFSFGMGWLCRCIYYKIYLY